MALGPMTAKIDLDARPAVVSLLRLMGDAYRHLGDDAHERADAIEAALAAEGSIVAAPLTKAGD